MAVGNDWNSFMQSKRMRVLLYGLCTVFCGYYSLGAVMDLVSPGDSARMLAESMGQLGYVVMTVLRLLACLWAAIAFARLALAAAREDDE